MTDDLDLSPAPPCFVMSRMVPPFGTETIHVWREGPNVAVVFTDVFGGIGIYERPVPAIPRAVTNYELTCLWQQLKPGGCPDYNAPSVGIRFYNSRVL